jgi:hypothetical protein
MNFIEQWNSVKVYHVDNTIKYIQADITLVSETDESLTKDVFWIFEPEKMRFNTEQELLDTFTVEYVRSLSKLPENKQDIKSHYSMWTKELDTLWNTSLSATNIGE